MSSVSVSTLTAFWGSVIYWIDSHCTTCTQLILVIDSQYEPACSQTAELLRGSFCTVLGGQFSWSALIKTFRWAISLEKHLREKVCEPAPVLGLLHNVPLLHHQLAPLVAQPGQKLVSGNFLFLNFLLIYQLEKLRYISFFAAFFSFYSIVCWF